MTLAYKRWNKLFLFCLGIFIGSAFCMKWMEADFLYNEKIFTIIGLEITYPKEKIIEIFSGISSSVHSILGYHLYFDFIFMTGVYPGIAALCMMAREKRANSVIKKLLASAALLQIVAFGCDIIENYYLLKWLANPQIGVEFSFFHIVVSTKWFLAIAAALIAIPLVIKGRLAKK
jgi:hypothetical protein